LNIRDQVNPHVVYYWTLNNDQNMHGPRLSEPPPARWAKRPALPVRIGKTVGKMHHTAGVRTMLEMAEMPDLMNGLFYNPFQKETSIWGKPVEILAQP
jgi:hypothetical protein